MTTCSLFLHMWFQFLVVSAFYFCVISAYRDGKYSSLRLNDLQMKGSHNSYHLRPKPSLPQWEFNHESLSSQLNQGIYSLEFDVYYDNKKFTVAQHSIYDANSSCSTLSICLKEVENWLLVQDYKPIIWIAIGNNEPWTEQQWNDLDALLREVWSEDELLTPDLLRGSYTSVQEAIFQRGWPVVRDVAGKVIVTLDNVNMTSEYSRNSYANLLGRVALPYYTWENRTHSNAVLLSMETPSALITDAVKMGYIVRTRADAYLPTFPITYQLQIDTAYFDVMDINDDNVVNVTELSLFHVYGVPDRVVQNNLTDTSRWATQIIQSCGTNKNTLSWGTEFYCYQTKCNYSHLFSLSAYSSIQESYTRLQLAVASGAHQISSDYPTPGTGQSGGYYLKLGASASYHLQCNPVTTNSRNESQFHILCKQETLNQQYYAPAPSLRNAILLSFLLAVTVLGLVIMMLYQYCRSKPSSASTYRLNQEDNNINTNDTHAESGTRNTCFLCCPCKKEKRNYKYVQITYDTTLDHALDNPFKQ